MAEQKKTSTAADLVKQDLADAAVAEARSKALVVTYGGEEYTIAPDTLSSIEFLEAVEDAKPFGIVRAALGRVQWAQFKLRHTTGEEFSEFLDAFGKRSGSGNS